MKANGNKVMHGGKELVSTWMETGTKGCIVKGKKMAGE